MQEIGVQTLPRPKGRQLPVGLQRQIRVKERTDVKDRFRKEIGAKELPLEWSQINWQPIKQRVSNLRRRIYRATQNQQWNRVRSLMKLMLRSYANLLLSVRRVTQENQGKKTAGLDGLTALTPASRRALAQQMQSYRLWQIQPVQRIYIPKAGGKSRPLGIPCIADRIAQAMVKNALEPSWEARFESHSYGFRPGRSTHDAIQQSWLRLKRDSPDRWVLDADIRGAFDNICHDFLLDKIGQVPGRALIKQWLKAGYVEAEMFHPTTTGTCQGGVISPLLANIALDGMEALLAQYRKAIPYTLQTGKEKGRLMYRRPLQYGFVRYADDFIITATTRAELEAIIPILTEWLAIRGLELHPDKTQIVRAQDGFDFLGFNIRLFPQGCFPVPQKQKVLAFVQSIRDWLKHHPNVSPEIVIRYLNPKLRGWGNYYRHGVSARVFQFVDSQVWQAIWRWCLRRHPNKGKTWVASKYFRDLNNRAWTFATTTNPRNRPQLLSLFRLSSLSIQRHVKVKGNASPDDPQLAQYWHERQLKYGKSYWGKGSKLYQVAQNQGWKCPVCGESLFNGESLHTHHVIPVQAGGTDRQDNLLHLHQACHQQIHMGKRSNSRRLEPDDG
jgi:RNA-directed DNA polymerase